MRYCIIIKCWLWGFSSILLQNSFAQETSLPFSNNNEIPASIRFVTDSLKKVLDTTLDDSKRITLYGKICWSYLGAPALAEAARYADSVHWLAQKTADSAAIIKAFFYYGVIARLSSDYQEALKYIHQHVRFYERKGDSSRVAGGLYQLGTIYSHLGDYDKSLNAYYRSLAIEEKDNNHYSIGYTLNTIAIVLKETGNTTDAETVYRKALQIFDTLGANNDKTDVLVNLGNLFTQTGKLDSARIYYDQALHIDRLSGKQSGVAMSLANIAFLFDRKKQYDSALSYHLHALAIREKLTSKEYYARSLIGVGMGYKQLQKFTLAKEYLNKALVLVTALNAKPMLKDIYEHLSDIYAAEKNYSEAYRYQVMFNTISDSLLNQQKARQLMELKTKYETDQKDQQINLLSIEKKLSDAEAGRQNTIRKTLIVGLIMLALLFASIFLLYRQRLNNEKILARKNEIIRESKFNQQMSELELKALRAQINPHFLFNCMNSINRLILEGENEKASAYLSKFSKLIRLILESAGSASIPLDQELKLLESYIQLEKLRFKDRINYQVDVDENIDCESTYIPTMVLQPFVENAIWHGLMHNDYDKQGCIRIHILRRDEELFCSIEDNGVGREKARQLKDESVPERKSMGMQITEERLRLMNREKDEQPIKIIDLKTSQNNATGTRVELRIPTTL